MYLSLSGSAKVCKHQLVASNLFRLARIAPNEPAKSGRTSEAAGSGSSDAASAGAWSSASPVSPQ